MRMPPLLADIIHARACLPICEKFLTLPKGPAADTLRDDKEEKAQITEKTVALLWVTVFLTIYCFLLQTVS